MFRQFVVACINPTRILMKSYSCKTPKLCPKIRTKRGWETKSKPFKIKLLSEIEQEKEDAETSVKIDLKRFKSFWDITPECCYKKCPRSARYDESYYMPSNPYKRYYNKTWVDCLKVEKEALCVDEIQGFLEPEYRSRKMLKECSSRKTHSKIPKHLMACKNPNVESSSCLSNLQLLHCRSVRKPPKCKKTRLASMCKKVNPPCPSFSECELIKKLNSDGPTECKCWQMTSLCETVREMRQRP
ncbi:uncharacterized protein LOC119677020 [Teleopsis dalmanni]|uniref:uncharacterized protein LOC119677020 n=1 Tax=Teleopsis dalmanni TaxID=139649 RepID=UPI0018CF0F6C|nr:uncharacterized protein LOC119677020 [Teleopsis dalmanni]